MSMGASRWYRFLHPPETCIFLPHEAQHCQVEPRTHCTNTGSHDGSKDFIPIPNDSQGAVT